MDATEKAARKGHGYVRERGDGQKARCGGPEKCVVCQAEQALLDSHQIDFFTVNYNFSDTESIEVWEFNTMGRRAVLWDLEDMDYAMSLKRDIEVTEQGRQRMCRDFDQPYEKNFYEVVLTTVSKVVV